MQTKRRKLIKMNVFIENYDKKYFEIITMKNFIFKQSLTVLMTFF